MANIYASGYEFYTRQDLFKPHTHTQRERGQAAAISAMQIEPKTDPNPPLPTYLPPPPFYQHTVNNNFKILVSARLSNAIWYFIERASEFYVNF